MAPAQESSTSFTKEISSVPLLDVGRGNKKIRQEILKKISEVYDAGCFVYGPDCRELESRIAEISSAKYAIGCASGSEALLVALMAHDIGPGDEVILPSFTFFATASAVWRLGAKVVFADIDPSTFNMDAKHVESLVNSNTRAIIPVHLFGQCADMDLLGKLADQHGLLVIEDAAQSIGAKFNGKACGAIGHVGCFSFYPTKNLGGCGDAGMMTTDDEALSIKLRRLANHGMDPRYYHSLVGINSRLDTFQAVALNAKLNHLEEYTSSRQDNASYYRELMDASGLSEMLELPEADSRCEHVWNQFTVRISAGRRDEVRAGLKQRGVGSEIYYPVPMHLQECFQSLGYRQGDLPHTEKAAQEVLSLPIFPELTRLEQEYVVESLVRVMRGRDGLKLAS